MKNQTEIVPAGELSPALLTALKKAGDGIEMNHVAHWLAGAEHHRVSFAVHALCTGLLLLAKKQSIAHGKFKAFCCAALAEANRQKSHTVRLFKPSKEAHDGESYKTAARYMSLTREVLLQIQTPDLRNPVGSRIATLLSETKTPAPQDMPALVLDAQRQGEVVEFFEQVAGGWSLRDLMRHLRHADREAEKDELAEQEQGRRGKPSPSPEEKAEAELAQARQLYFEDLLPEVRTRFLEETNWQLLEKAERRQLADALHAAYQAVHKTL